MSDNTVASTVQRAQESSGQRLRAVRSKMRRKMFADCDHPILLPQQILWCSNNDGPAKQWLLDEALPWWFFASFINFCTHVHTTGTARGRYSVAQHRLLACLKKYPMQDVELIKEMKWHLVHAAHLKMYKKGAVDVEELKGHDNPETVLSQVQEELYRMIFSPIQREIHQIAMDIDRPAAAAPEYGKQGSPAALVAPTVFHTFTLPLRLGAPPSLEGSPGRIEQQQKSGDLLAQVQEDDMGMQLD